MGKYISILEEWDDIIGEGWDSIECNFLNVWDYLKNDVLENNII